MTKARFYEQLSQFGLFELVVAIAIGGFVNVADAQNVGDTLDLQKYGIRFQIKALIEPLNILATNKADDDRSRASLDVILRISTHATGSNFYGEIPQHFADVALARGSDERLYWQDQQCHQRRGLPTVTITKINGSVTTKDGRIDVKATPRILGKLLPTDEISSGGRLHNRSDKGGRYMAHQFQTRSSHLSLTVKIYTIDCDLTSEIRLLKPSETHFKQQDMQGRATRD